jgi:hypothetical protein
MKTSTLQYLLVFVLFTITQLKAGKQKDTTHWKNPVAELKCVFVNNKFSNKTEILKLYKDQTFELITYSTIMKRDVGTYLLSGNKLKLNPPKNKTGRYDLYSKSLIYVPSKGIYSSLFNSIFKKKEYLLPEKNINDYDFPFYLDPDSKTIVLNKEAPDKIDLYDLVKNLTKHARSEREKMMAIIRFIHASVEYDYPAYYYNNYSNSQDNFKQIIAGKKRLAVCSGYSGLFMELCKIAGINCEKISGYAKNTKSEINRDGEPHAWNKVMIDGKEELYDITWADNKSDEWLNVNPEIMIYTHFPNNKKNQLLNSVVTLEEFTNMSFILPFKEVVTFTDFAPKTGKVFCDSTFTFTIDGEAKDISISEMSGDYFNLNINSDSKKGPKSFDVSYIKKFNKNIKDGKTYLEIPIKYKVSCITIKINACSYSYKVIKGNLNELFSNYIKNTNKGNLDAYIKGVISSIILNDKEKLIELTGENQDLFFDKKGNIKKDLVNKFKDWDGFLGSISLRSVISFMVTYESNKSNEVKNNSSETTIKRVISVGKNEFVYEKNGDDYIIKEID